MTDEFLTPQAAADLLNVPISFIYERTRHNAIPLRRIGRYVRIPKDELMSWIDTQGQSKSPGSNQISPAANLGSI